MEFALLIYAIEIISAIGNLSGMIIFAAILVFLIGGVITIISEGEFLESQIKYFNTKLAWAKYAFVIVVVVEILIPSRTTMHTMIAAYAGQTVIASDAVGRLAPKSLQLIEGYLDKQIESMESEE